MFSNKSNIIALDFYDNDAIQSDFIQVKIQESELNIDLLSFTIKIENGLKKVSINCDLPYVSYYIGLYPLSEQFIYDSNFTFDELDDSEYCICAKYNEKIIILGNLNQEKMNNLNENWSLRNTYPEVIPPIALPIVINYDKIELISISASETRIFPIGSFHKISLDIVGDAVLSINSTSQTYSNCNISLDSSAYNVDSLTVVVSANSSIKGIVTK